MEKIKAVKISAENVSSVKVKSLKYGVDNTVKKFNQCTKSKQQKPVHVGGNGAGKGR